MPIYLSENDRANCWASKPDQDSQLKGAILGAGLGRRLDPLTTYHLPKPMFPLGGKVPIAEVWVRRLIESGIPNVSMNLCVLAESIKRHFKTGAKFGVDLTYVEEEVPTGTLGGVCKMVLGNQAKKVGADELTPPITKFSGSTIVAPSGDIVANFDAELLREMYEIHRKAGSALTMVLTKVPASRRADFGTVVLQAPEERDGTLSLSGRISDFREKDPESPSCLSNASIYMIEKDLLQVLDGYRTEAAVGTPDPFYDFGKHVFPAMLGRLPYVTLPKDYPLWGVQFDGLWFDVGNKRDYLRVNKRVLDGKIEIPLMYERLPWGFLGSNVIMDFSKVEIRSPVVIGNNCFIAPGAVLGPYAIIGDGWRVGEGATIRNSVLWERYPYFVDGTRQVSDEDRQIVDRHEIRHEVQIDESIIAGGWIKMDAIGKTVDVRDDGEPVAVDIDYIPSETRA